MLTGWAQGSRLAKVQKLVHEVGTESEEWEGGPRWTETVCSPLSTYPLAPREALVLLIVAGELKRMGLDVGQIGEAMLTVAWPKQR